MRKNYTIIIPIFNEKSNLPDLLDNLKIYNDLGHEILIVNDGSTDGSKEILSNCNFIQLLNLDKNSGKGFAIIKGLDLAKNNKIIIFDGDLELDPIEIKKLMILDKHKKINSVFANRFKNQKERSIWNIGNKFFTILFNLFNNSNIEDALCCAKAFYKSDISIESIKSKNFSIDIEITSKLIKQYPNANNIDLSYNRRTIAQGKKLRLSDGLSILFTIFSS